MTYGSTRGSETCLDAHDDQGLEFPVLEHGEELGCGHREKRLFDGAEVQRTQGGKAETIIGLPKGYSRERKGRCLSRVTQQSQDLRGRTSRILFGDYHRDIMDLYYYCL